MDKAQMKKLKETINSVYETDMGDFKRRVITYLNLFLEQETEAFVKLQVTALKKFIVCFITPEQNPKEEIDALRLTVLKKLENI